MKFYDHLLLKLFSLLTLLFGLILFIIGTGLFKDYAYLFLDFLYANPTAQIILATFALMILLGSIRFLLFSKRNVSIPTINLRNELGEMRISITTLENLASRVLSRIPGITDWKVRFRSSETEGHQYFIKVTVDGETSIPKLTEEIQKQVKLAAEEATGLEIRKVSVLIGNIHAVSTQINRRVE